MSLNTQNSEAIDPSALLRAIPQPITRIGLVVLSLISVLTPVLSSSALGMSRSVRIDELPIGGYAALLPLAMVAALFVATLPATQRYHRIVDAVAAVVALLLGVAVLVVFFRGVHELNAANNLMTGLSGMRQTMPVSIGFSFGIAPLAATILWSLAQAVGRRKPAPPVAE